MNFTTLSYFLAVAEELNITKAAQRLYISQQSLSSQIIKLEDELGVKLFNRKPEFSLTYAGTRLVKASRQIMAAKRQVLSEIDDINRNQRGEIKIGISHTRGKAILPDILPFFKETHPLVEISLFEENSQSLEQKLAHGMIDLMISFSPFNLDNVETIPLNEDRLFMVVHQKFLESFENKDLLREHLKQSADITLFKDFPFLLLKTGNRIRTIVDDYFYSKGISPQIILETENVETAFALALRGMGITIYPEMFLQKISTVVEKNVDLYPINDPSTIGTLAIGFNHKHYLSDSAKDFIALAVKTLKKD